MGSYVPNTKEQRQEMLKEIGFQTIDDLFAHIPAEVKIQGGLNIPEGKTELEVRRDMENIAAKNQVFKTIFRGAGAYRHFIPATVKSVISKENLLTAYTPYQAEISQGILQSIFEYQTMICDLTGMDISNACVYDGAEASAEGVAMCRDRKRSKALVSATVNPYVLETIKTYCFGNEMEIEVIPEKDGLTDIEYLKEHGREPKAVYHSDPDAVYAREYTFDLSKVRPVVAKPDFVDNVVPAEEACGIEINEAFLGSCNNGRIEDLRVGAEIIKGKKVSDKVRFLVVPASQTIYRQALKEGLIDIFMEAGAIVMNPNCSVCWGSCQGVIGENEVLISTGTRNFKGRAGHPSSKVYLGSAATVTASAIAGKIALPSEI